MLKSIKINAHRFLFVAGITSLKIGRQRTVFFALSNSITTY